MIGARNMESGILGGYVDFMRRTHPDAPIPGVYLAEGLFRDAQALRDRMGDDAFFSALSEGTSSSSGWGELAAGWDAERFENAIIAEPGSEERSQLIGALIDQFFRSYVPQGLPLQPCTGTNPHCGFQRPSTRAHCPRGDDATAGRAAGHPHPW